MGADSARGAYSTGGRAPAPQAYLFAEELREFLRTDFAEAFEPSDFRFAAEFFHRLGAQKL
jgi:hypothetical protein